MGFREHMVSGEGWLPPSARLVRDSGEVLFIEPARHISTESHAHAYATGWFERAFRPAMFAFTLGQRDDLDPDIDTDLIADFDNHPEGTWIAFGVAYRYR